MATELGKAYVQIIPSAKGIAGSISSELNGEAASAGQSAGASLVGKLKGVIAAAGIGAALKQALEAGGALQQSFGGLDTLYGDAAEGAKKYAVEAAAAGISANDYAEQAVSFGAALKQAFGGDTTAAMEAANTAILDMADNSAKMGTDIGSIQTAYQGFAKQNYTMLDNLKLGYGGTKGEMERLLEDAQKLSGVEYNIDNLGDVYSAIHVIQEDLGLTGVAAEEASSTFSGSFNAMKAAGENLLASLTLGEDIGPALDTLSQSVQTFLFNNLFPMVGNVLSALPELVSGVGSMIIGSLNMVSENADEIVQMGIDFVTSLVSAIVESAPYLVEAAWSLISALGTALFETDWVAIGTELMNNLKNSIDLAAGEIFGSDGNILQAFLDNITASLPGLLNAGVEIITNLMNGILSSFPQIIAMAGELVTTLAGFIIENAPALLSAGIDLIINLVNGFLDNLPAILTAAAQLVADLVAFLLQNAPKLLQTGIELIAKLAVGLIQAIPKIIAAIPQIIRGIIEPFTKYNWPQIGMNIIIGIKNGVLNAAKALIDAVRETAKAAWDTITGFFDIHSPSRLTYWAGEMIDKGLAEGIVDNKGMVNSAIDSLNAAASGSFKASYAYEGTQDSGNLEALTQLLNTYLPQIANGNVNITLEGDAGRLFRLMQRESIRNTQLVGVDSVLSAI